MMITIIIIIHFFYKRLTGHPRTLYRKIFNKKQKLPSMPTGNTGIVRKLGSLETPSPFTPSVFFMSVV